MHDTVTPAYLSVQAETMPDCTVLTVAGPPAEAGSLLSAVAAKLWRPDPARVAGRIEALRRTPRGAGPLTEALFWRFGAVGLGVSRMDRVGLATATPERLAIYARRVFARGNAAVALDAPPPPTLRLDLPEGGRQPLPRPRQVSSTPASYAHSDPAVILTGLLPRSASALLTVRILEAKVVATLRHAEGVSYSPQGGYLGLGNDAITTLLVDVQPGSEERAAGCIATSLAQLASLGPAPQDLEDQRRAYLQQLRNLSEHDSRPWLLAQGELTGRPPASIDELERELSEVSPQSVARDASFWRNSALLGLPPGVSVPDGYPTATAPADPELREVASVHRSLDGDLGEFGLDEIQLSPQGIRMGTMTFWFADVVAMLAWPDGLRQLFRRDGWHLRVEPNLWEGGHGISRALDAAVDPALVAHLPAREVDEIPQSPTTIALTKQAEAIRKRARRLPWLIGLVVVFFGGFDLLLEATGAGTQHVFLLVGAPVLAFILVATWLVKRRLSAVEDKLAQAREGNRAS